MPRFTTHDFDGFTWVVVDEEAGVEFCTCTEHEEETLSPKERAEIVAAALNAHFVVE